MTPNQQFILKLLDEGKDYLRIVLQVVLPVVLGWHLPGQPPWMKKVPDEKAP